MERMTKIMDEILNVLELIAGGSYILLLVILIIAIIPITALGKQKHAEEASSEHDEEAMTLNDFKKMVVWYTKILICSVCVLFLFSTVYIHSIPKWLMVIILILAVVSTAIIIAAIIYIKRNPIEPEIEEDISGEYDEEVEDEEI